MATNEPKKHKSSAAVRAGQLFDKLQRLDAEEAAEIAEAPESIRERYSERRAKLFDAADPEVQELCAAMRAK